MKRILLVDDEVDVLEMLQMLLEQEGYEVVTAANGRAALDAIDGQVPDLLITDLMMPLMTGEELLAEVRNLLIVDDDEDIVEALAELLVMEGHTVRVAHDGVEGLERMKESKPDVVLLDVDMPRLSGPEMAYEAFIRDAGLEAIPIVLLSARVDLRRVAATVGTPYLLPKPYALDSLLALLRRALSEHIPPKPRLAAADARS